MSLISDAMRAALGREVARQVSFPVSESDIRRWVVAIHHPEPPPRHFWDADAAAATVHGGIVAPEDFNPFAWMTAAGPPPFTGGRAGEDVGRVERTLGVPRPDVHHELNGGVEIEYGVRMRPGDVVTSVLRLHSYSERAGRLGPMLMTVLEDTWTRQDSAPVKVQRTTVIRY